MNPRGAVQPPPVFETGAFSQTPPPLQASGRAAAAAATLPVDEEPEGSTTTGNVVPAGRTVPGKSPRHRPGGSAADIPAATVGL